MGKIKQSINNYFIVTPPGLEEVANQELQDKWQYFKHHLEDFYQGKVDSIAPQAAIEKGGLTISLPGLSGSLLNYYLKVPTEIRMVLTEFHAKDFPKIYQKSRHFNWQRILKNQKVTIKATSKKSRLIHSERISATIKKSIDDFFENTNNKKSFQENEYEQEIHARMVNDKLSLSINLSGQALFKRSNKQLQARAPLRENLAYACLYSLTKKLDQQSLSICDPMCGSQTLLIEARDFHLPNTNRDFAFEHLRPIQEYAYKLKEYRNIKFQNPFKTILGKDRIVQETQNGITFAKADLFESNNSEEFDLILTNLPYGKRIKLDRPIEEFIEKINKNMTYQLFGYISAHDTNDDVLLKFSNGGIPVKLYLKKGL